MRLDTSVLWRGWIAIHQAHHTTVEVLVFNGRYGVAFKCHQCGDKISVPVDPSPS